MVFFSNLPLYHFIHITSAQCNTSIHCLLLVMLEDDFNQSHMLYSLVLLELAIMFACNFLHRMLPLLWLSVTSSLHLLPLSMKQLLVTCGGGNKSISIIYQSLKPPHGCSKLPHYHRVQPLTMSWSCTMQTSSTDLFSVVRHQNARPQDFDQTPHT